MEENKDLPSTNDTTKASTEVSTQVSNEAVTHTVGEHIHATDEDLSFKQSYAKASEAVAISYDEDKKSPFIAALGNESRAQAIIDMAKELGVYVHKDPTLLNELKHQKEAEGVPKELYSIIAEILAFSYYLQGKTPSSYTRPDGSRAINTDA